MQIQGEILKKLLKEKKIRQEDFASWMGISRNYLIILFKEKVIKNKYLDKAVELLNVNKNVFTLPSDQQKDPGPNFEKLSTVDIIQELYQEVQKSKDNQIGNLEKNNDHLVDVNKRLIAIAEQHAHTSEVMSKIVDLCLKAGAIIVDPKKKVDLTNIKH